MDNFCLDVCSSGELSLKLVLQLACAGKGFHVNALHRTSQRLTLLWAGPRQPDPCVVELPKPRTAEEIFPLVLGWLKNEADYGPKSQDLDVSSWQGWRVWTLAWGHVEQFGPYGICMIEPLWALAGK